MVVFQVSGKGGPHHHLAAQPTQSLMRGAATSRGAPRSLPTHGAYEGSVKSWRTGLSADGNWRNVVHPSWTVLSIEGGGGRLLRAQWGPSTCWWGAAATEAGTLLRSCTCGGDVAAGKHVVVSHTVGTLVKLGSYMCGHTLNNEGLTNDHIASRLCCALIGLFTCHLPTARGVVVTMTCGSC